MKEKKKYLTKINNIFLGNKTRFQIKFEVQQFLKSIYKHELLDCKKLIRSNKSTKEVYELVKSVTKELKTKLEDKNGDGFFDEEILMIELNN